MDYQKKDDINPERHPQRNRSKQLQTHNVPTYDVVNLFSYIFLTAEMREEIYDSLTSRGLFSKEQKGYCKESRGTG